MEKESFLEKAVRAVEDMKGINISIINVENIVTHMDYVFICSGTSDRHVISIAENLKSKVKRSAKPFSIEGMDDGNWVLLDYGWIIFHVFREEVREYYRLEELWRNGKFIEASHYLKDVLPKKVLSSA
ncbi:MAG: ribosome silencing factor [Nitrospinae bacterium]|nr:ribosome silencing factor [Nitrospinota bacterium]